MPVSEPQSPVPTSLSPRPSHHLHAGQHHPSHQQQQHSAATPHPHHNPSHHSHHGGGRVGMSRSNSSQALSNPHFLHANHHSSAEYRRRAAVAGHANNMLSDDAPTIATPVEHLTPMLTGAASPGSVSMSASEALNGTSHSSRPLLIHTPGALLHPTRGGEPEETLTSPALPAASSNNMGHVSLSDFIEATTRRDSGGSTRGEGGGRVSSLASSRRGSQNNLLSLNTAPNQSQQNLKNLNRQRSPQASPVPPGATSSQVLSATIPSGGICLPVLIVPDVEEAIFSFLTAAEALKAVAAVPMWRPHASSQNGGLWRLLVDRALTRLPPWHPASIEQPLRSHGSRMIWQHMARAFTFAVAEIPGVWACLPAAHGRAKVVWILGVTRTSLVFGLRDITDDDPAKWTASTASVPLGNLTSRSAVQTMPQRVFGGFKRVAVASLASSFVDVLPTPSFASTTVPSTAGAGVAAPYCNSPAALALVHSLATPKSCSATTAAGAPSPKEPLALPVGLHRCINVATRTSEVCVIERPDPVASPNRFVVSKVNGDGNVPGGCAWLEFFDANPAQHRFPAIVTLRPPSMGDPGHREPAVVEVVSRLDADGLSHFRAKLTNIDLASPPCSYLARWHHSDFVFYHILLGRHALEDDALDLIW